MPKHPFQRAVAVAAIIFALSAVGQAHAGQVVTDAVKQWAHRVVSREASLDFKPEANTVAVLYFQNNSNQANLDFLQQGMAIMLITDLAKLPEIQVVERTRLQALTQEIQMGSSGIVAADSAPRMGRLLGARYLVGGDINAGRTDTIDVQSNLLEVPRDGVLGSPSGSGKFDAIIKMEKEILFELIRLLHIELSEAQKEELSQPITTDIKALKFLVQGVRSSDQGDYERAAEFYQRALKLDPGLVPARSAILELGELKLLPAGRGTAALLRNLRNRVSVNRGPIPDQVTKRRNSEPASVLGPAGTQPTDVRVQW